MILLLTYINKIQKRNLHAEYENNSSINFIDLNTTKLEHRYIYSMWKKPTTTDILIHNSSNATYTVCLQDHDNRLNNIPLEENTIKPN